MTSAMAKRGALPEVVAPEAPTPEDLTAELTPTREGGILRGMAQGFSWAVLLFLVVVALAVIVVPAVTRSTPYTILTSSMVPVYPPGAMVIVRPVATEDIHIGTVITYQLKSGEPELVTHRVIAINQPNLVGGEPTFITKGDANDIADENPVQVVQIRGKVWYSVPYIGWINNIITGHSRAVAVPLIVGGLFLYAGYQLVSAGFERRRRGRAQLAEDA